MAKACFPFTRPLSSTTAEMDETIFRLIVDRPKIAMPTETTKEVPQDIVEALRSWDRTAGQLRFAQVFLGVLGTSAALAVTTFTLELSPIIVKGLSFTAALCIGLITAFDLNGRANIVRRAWRHLNTVALRYRNVPEASLDSVVDAYSQAEEMLGDVTFQRLANERRD